MMKKTMLVIGCLVFTSGCSFGRDNYRNNGGFGSVTYNDVQYVYGTREPVMSREELSKYNGIRIGSDGRVKSLVKLPTPTCDELPHYTYNPPAEFRESYKQERCLK